MGANRDLQKLSVFRRSPRGPVAGFQRWADLLFLHWRIPVEMLQPLLPETLTAEECDGSGWIGLVPFKMQRVRPWWWFSVPGLSWFLETNVRTYVRHRDGTRGVWFFSLDADNRIAVSVARRFWNLPYYYAEMTCTEDSTEDLRSLTYMSAESGDLANIPSGGTEKANLPEAAARRHSLVAGRFDKTVPPCAAQEGSLEEFLLERYVLFCSDHHGRLLHGYVHHEPYAFRSAQADPVLPGLVTAAVPEFHPSAVPDHVAMSPGVDVRVHALQPVG